MIEPHEYALFPKWFQDPGFRKKIAWSYVDARDLGEICHRCIETSGLGFQIFNAASGDTSSELPTAEPLKRFYPNVPVKAKLGEFETLLSNKKAREVLEFKQQHFWRDYVKG
ncbi:MAG: hypothetical protein ACREEP_10070 [Dongiaceae bacterium]